MELLVKKFFYPGHIRMEKSLVAWIIRVLDYSERLMSPTSTMSPAFCFSTSDAFDPPLNPPTLSIHYALIPSTPVASLPTSPCEPCHSSLSLIPASSPFTDANGRCTFILKFGYSSNAQLRSQRGFRKMQGAYPAATSRHYISTLIALPCTHSLRI